MDLIRAIQQTLKKRDDYPFAIYESIKEQKLLNVPVLNPLLIVVLKGIKELVIEGEVIACKAGDFIFLTDSPSVDMRNIPAQSEYQALLIEFSHDDFLGFSSTKQAQTQFCIGSLTPSLEPCLSQFIQSSDWAPESIIASRRKEILFLLSHLGCADALSSVAVSKISNRLHSLFCEPTDEDLSMQQICDSLAMSESTLRRKLKSEGTTVQTIKDRAKLGLGLHLLQSTDYTIGVISQICGYQSQSRFTERFKSRFGLTPTQLRNTKKAV
ncbi:helix-turn-helix transcriptional regulator [Pseudoalteromonas sp. JBTF-M23]|uniref:Helix-turn-helix transcriptional regulator n=1 Tax=Pseudoalteromonas caenipelagi TaxID=2726988 RepID=A0A849VB64_9GAMM|nr:helix-turn-helix transcriptional regulator [Pseudoalteromonas caenipelagi]